MAATTTMPPLLTMCKFFGAEAQRLLSIDMQIAAKDLGRTSVSKALIPVAPRSLMIQNLSTIDCSSFSGELRRLRSLLEGALANLSRTPV
jgi:hypothetical protein